MYNNHHAQRLASLDREAAQADSNLRQLQADIDWFDGFDYEGSYSRLTQVQREGHAVREQLAQVDASLRNARGELDQAQGTAQAGWSPLHWFSSERSVAKRQVDTVQQRLRQFQEHRKSLASALQAKEGLELRLLQGVQTYRNFDPLQAKATVALMGGELLRLQGVAEEARQASERWEAAAGKVYRYWKACNEQLQAVEQDIVEAECLIDQLNTAASTYDKKKVHIACEQRFGAGQGSPDRVLRERQGQQRKLQRDEEKLQRRLRDIVRLLDNEIRHLVIDGNNLCYFNEEGSKQRFIGLAALKPLVPRLAATYGVTLVFDPGIRSQLDMSESELQALFPQARVMVMPRMVGADHPVLAAAQFDAETYVISNDQYGDYPDMAVVREERVLHAVLHRDSVQVPQLQVLVPY